MTNDITFCELREKEIINIIDGKRLGRILDMVLTLQGQIIGIVAPGEKKFFKNIATNDSLFIPWKCIKKIGEDTILVELTAPYNPHASATTVSSGSCNNSGCNNSCKDGCIDSPR